ncbi:VanZ family protein [Thalassoglobus polymorphus]|uniref:VanZ like family protein n=1 Tax=Thalassoglobus polymorphus TaxID=2527994 RepID=A0A517QSQ5_9PLAN|nr:VanZ family protein [Thalassoglobus polymorphus]QDT34655.1 VanZ like family protein [Thalassoglobus polymorphus]
MAKSPQITDSHFYDGESLPLTSNKRTGDGDWLRKSFSRLILPYWTLLTYLLLAPHPLWFLTGLSQPDEFSIFTMSDLIQHLSAFAVLGFLLSTQFSPSGRTSKLLYASGFYAVITELLQWFIPNRHAAISDMLANASGLIIGWSCYLLLRSLFSTRTISFQTR